MSRIELIISLLQRNPSLPPPFMPFRGLDAELPEMTGDGSPDTFPTKYPEALTAGLERIRLSAHHSSWNPGMGGACDGGHAGSCNRKWNLSMLRAVFNFQIQVPTSFNPCRPKYAPNSRSTPIPKPPKELILTGSLGRNNTLLRQPSIHKADSSYLPWSLCTAAWASRIVLVGDCSAACVAHPSSR